jgi:Baseplate J-like protein
MTFVQNPGSLSPVFDYSSRDYASILTDLLNRKQVYLPEWTSQSNNDFGIVLLQEFAYACDILHYYMDRLSAEAFIQTATQPQSILNLAALIGYTPYLSVGADVDLSVTVSSSLSASSYPVEIPTGTQFATVGTTSQPPIIFTTTQDLSIGGPYSATPSVVGSVPATQGVQYVNEQVATSNGTIDQAYQLKNNPVSANSFTVYVDLGTGSVAWTFVATLVGTGPFDHVFTNFVDANQNFFIVFGDGVNGYVPPLGSPITATYQTNSGAIGNVGANTITTYLNPPVGRPRVAGITNVTNPLAASAGAYAESIQSIQSQAPASLQALNRGVTVHDINVLAQQISGFAWASAVQETYQLVNLYMAPNGGGALSTLQINNVEAAMSNVVMANTTVTVLSPTYVSVDISANVTAYANFSNLAVQQSIIQALDNLLSLNNTGFGFRVALGLIYETINSVSGVNYSSIEPIRVAPPSNPLNLTANPNCSGLTREVMVTLNSALSSGQSYTSLNVTQVPQQIPATDLIVLNNGASNQTLTVASSAEATIPEEGATTINVAQFTANANYPVGTPITDISLLTDAVFLPNEIPIVGVLTINVSGGTTP